MGMDLAQPVTVFGIPKAISTQSPVTDFAIFNSHTIWMIYAMIHYFASRNIRQAGS
jgi:hypothetical protein